MASVVAAGERRVADASDARLCPVTAMHAATAARPATVIVRSRGGRRNRWERAEASVARTPTSTTKVTANGRIVGSARPTASPVTATAVAARAATVSTGRRWPRGGNIAVRAQPAANHQRSRRSRR
jgi:hypothetical protein